jgi:predicted nucleotidyltransferase
VSTGITEKERRVLSAVLAPFANAITEVGIFGSRATGLARKNSDIDLVIYGDLDVKAERRLWTLLEDSDLPVSVDLVVYSRINSPLLKEQIDTVAAPLFTQQELLDERHGRST